MKKPPEEFARPQPRAQVLRVLLLPHGVSQFGAQPEHLRSVIAQAENSIAAHSDPAVDAVVRQGFVVVEVGPADRPSPLQAAIHARAHRAALDAVEPIDSGLRGPNNRAPTGY